MTLAEAELIKTACSPTAIEISQAFVQHFLLAVVITTAAIAIVTAAIYAWQRRAGRDSDAVRDEAIFCRWMAMQIGESDQHAVDAGRAIETAAEVVGTDYAASWAPAIDAVRAGGQSGRALSLPAAATEPVQQCVVDLVAGRRDRVLIASDLQELSELYAAESSRYRQWWIETVPKWIAAVVMIGVIVILIQVIVAPLFDVISDVAP